MIPKFIPMFLVFSLTISYALAGPTTGSKNSWGETASAKISELKSKHGEFLDRRIYSA